MNKRYGAGADDYFVEYLTSEATMTFKIAQREIGGIRGKAARWVFEKAPRPLQRVVVAKMVSRGEHPISHDLELILGRKPRSLREWVRENKQAFAPPEPGGLPATRPTSTI